MIYPTSKLAGSAVMIGIATFTLAFVVPVFAGAQTNYTGTYSTKPTKGQPANSTSTTLRVVQNDEAIEITRIEGGKTVTSRFPLNGSEGDYTSPGGIAGKGKAHFRGKDLVLESVVVTRPQPGGPNVRMRTKERWQLSSDSKMLKIRFDVDFPDLRPLIGGTTDQSCTETYVRSDVP